MDFTSEAKDLKEAARRCVQDKPTKMSARVFAAAVYGAIRVGEIIDWWFPVKGLVDNKIN